MINEEMEIMNNEEIKEEEVTETTDMTVVDLLPVESKQGMSTSKKVAIGAGALLVGGLVVKTVGSKLKKVAVKIAANFVDKQEGYSVCRPDDPQYYEDDFFEEDFEEPEVEETPETTEE